VSEKIATIPKNSKEKIVFSLSEFKGKHYLDMRIFQIPENGGQDLPTKKGLTLSVELYPEFEKVLAQVEAELTTRGLLTGEEWKQ
jgi:hypothetical protein